MHLFADRTSLYEENEQASIVKQIFCEKLKNMINHLLLKRAFKPESLSICQMETLMSQLE